MHALLLNSQPPPFGFSAFPLKQLHPARFEHLFLKNANASFVVCSRGQQDSHLHADGIARNEKPEKKKRGMHTTTQRAAHILV